MQAVPSAVPVKPWGVREGLWALGAVLLVLGAIVVFVGLINVSSVYSGLGSGAFSNPNAPVPYGYPDTLLANAYAVQAAGFLMAFTGIALLLIPRR